MGSSDFRNEKSATNPQTAYAKCKVLVERDVSLLANDNFSPTFLRNATAYGPSPRMRFDIVLNNLCGLAWTTKKIAMTSDGSPWRPLVHVLDICNAILHVLEAPREVIHNEIFNLGKTEDNFTVREIAEIVAEVFSGCELTFGSSDGDNRSYRVNFDKIHEKLPNFICSFTPLQAAQQFKTIFVKIGFDKALFEYSAYTRVKNLMYLLDTKQIDNEFFWN